MTAPKRSKRIKPDPELVRLTDNLLTRPKNTLAKRHIRQRDAGNNSSRAQAWLVAFA